MSWKLKSLKLLEGMLEANVTDEQHVQNTHVRTFMVSALTAVCHCLSFSISSSCNLSAKQRCIMRKDYLVLLGGKCNLTKFPMSYLCQLSFFDLGRDGYDAER